MMGSAALRFVLWLLGYGAWIIPASGANPLRHVEEDLAQRYSGIGHCEPDVLAGRLRRGASGLTTLDVRSAEEFEVSHIAGAVRVDPNITANEFARRFAHLVEGRDVLAYCSVGLRSTAFAHRLRRTFIDTGANTVSNLRGGLFRWRNDGHPIVCRDGPAETIHPYNEYWARFLKQAATPR